MLGRASESTKARKHTPVFPEDRIGLINADRFSSILLDKLLLREIWRTIGFTDGTRYAPYRGCVMQPAFNDNEIAGLMGDVRR